jgi:hypothetical protein
MYQQIGLHVRTNSDIPLFGTYIHAKKAVKFPIMPAMLKHSSFNRSIKPLFITKYILPSKSLHGRRHGGCKHDRLAVLVLGLEVLNQGRRVLGNL